MVDGCTPFSLYLLDRWRNRIFGDRIFPEFPFRPSGWRALAFSRNNHGRRLPLGIWQRLITELSERSRDTHCFVISPDVLIGGLVMKHEQPFVVPLNAEKIEAHFADSAKYLPEFFMTGADEQWAIWGDSDFTILGGNDELISAVANGLGGWDDALEFMKLDFGLTGSSVDDRMRSYLEAL